MGALSKSSSMVDSPTLWELPSARPSPGESGLRKMENMKTGRRSLEAREDREDGYSSDASRRVYAEYQARSGIHASDTYGEGGRSTSLDSVTGRHTCRQVPDDARARGCNVEVTSTSFKSPRTGQVRREREQRERFNEGPMSLNVSSGTRCLDIGEQQSGNDRHRDKAFELCVGTESMAPLASNLSDRSCHALAEADGWPITDLTGGECPEPDSATVSWLARAVPRPCDGRFVLPGAADSLLPSRTRSPAISITGGRRHIVPVRIGSTGCGNDRAAQEIGERGREWSAVSRWTQRIADSDWHVGACQSVNRQLPSHQGGSNGR